MSNTATVPASATLKSGAYVRAYMADRPHLIPEGLEHSVVPNTRGQIPKALADAFKRATKSKMVYGRGVLDVPTVTIKGRKVPVAEVRPFAKAERGPITAADKAAYLAAQS